jgi:glycosyltransferase involved in cell wall biosynthesis
MIVKNEALTLERAVKSFEGVATEVVIGVDSSCTDETPQIAERLADVCFTFEWEDDFAKARNQAIEKCSGDWIFILDGHEYLREDCKQHVIALRDRCKPEIKVLAFNLYINPDPFGVPQLFLMQTRMFRNGYGIHYEKPAHNVLVGFDNETEMAGVLDVVIIHQMPPEREKWRIAQRKRMNIGRLREALEKNPNDARSWFYLANTYIDLGMNDEAEKCYLKYLPLSSFGEEKFQALLQLGLIARNKEDWDTAEQRALEALKVQWNRAEAYVLLGEVAYARQDWAEAAHWYWVAANMPPPPSVMFLQGKAYTWLPWRRLADCYMRLGRYDEALECVDKCREWLKDHPELKRAELEIRRRKIAQEAKSLGVSVQLPPPEPLAFPQKPKPLPNGKKRIVITAALDHFVQPLAGHWRQKGHEVKLNKELIWEDIAQADVVFFDFCDQNAILASQRRWPGTVAIRAHRYEIDSGFLNQVSWENVDHLIFVNQVAYRWTKELGLKEPQSPPQISVIKNIVDPQQWRFKNHKPGRKFAWVGYINWKKGIELLMEVCRRLRDWDRKAEIHIAGQFQHSEVERYFWEYVHGNNLSPNVRYHGWLGHEDLDEFLEDKDYILSTSIVEIQCLAVLEAMAKGIKPLIHCWPGADTIYLREWLWRHPEELLGLLETPYESARYRQYVKKHHSPEVICPQFDKLLEL